MTVAGALVGKVALVTGAGRGQGAEHACALARAGAAIVALDIGADIDGFYPMASESDLAATLARVESIGAEAMGFVADVRDSDAVATAVRAAHDRFGSIDIVCNNAGICRVEAIDEISDCSLDAVIDTNLKGPFNVARAVVPLMKSQQSGCIINIASAAAIKVVGYTSVYVATKAAAIAITKSWAHELAEWNIRVNGIAPGSIHNALTEGIAAQRRPRHGRSARQLARPASTPGRVGDGRRHRRDGGLPGDGESDHRTDLRSRRGLEHPLRPNRVRRFGSRRE